MHGLLARYRIDVYLEGAGRACEWWAILLLRSSPPKHIDALGSADRGTDRSCGRDGPTATFTFSSASYDLALGMVGLRNSAGVRQNSCAVGRP